jgi:hypothetical protein
VNVHEAAAEALTFCEALSPEDRGNMLAVTAMDKETVRHLLFQARAGGNADAIRFMEVAWFLHACVSALRYLSYGK